MRVGLRRGPVSSCNGHVLSVVEGVRVKCMRMQLHLHGIEQCAIETVYER